MTKDGLREKIRNILCMDEWMEYKINAILAIEIERECPECEGGYIYPKWEIAKICPKCKGTGKDKVKLGDLV